MGSSPDTVGIRDLKAHLSRHLRRVRAGARLQVTERGRPIATISPVAAPDSQAGVESLHRMVDEGLARWGGGKPVGCAGRVKLASGQMASDAVLADRR